MYDLASANYNVHITSKTSTSGLITIPGTAFSFPYSVISGTVTTVPLPGADVWNSTNGVVIPNKVVHVTSVAPVTVFASAEHQYRNEASMVLPTQVLGSKYCISTLPTDATSWSFDGQFTIVAAGASCTVKITPTQTVMDPTLICTAAVPYNVTLNIGECYQLQTATSGQNLAGTIVEALNGTDVFAVYSGHDCALIGATAAYDPLYEVEFPTYSWGKEYIITPVEECSYSKIHVGTVTDSNVIYADGVPVDTINIGQFYETNVSAATVVTSTYPIDVKQLMPSAGATGAPTTGPGDPSMGGIVPNDLMFLDSITFPHLAGNIDSHYISVVTRVNDTNTVFHNLVLLSGWTVLPQLTEYAYISVSTSAGSHSVATTGCGFLAYAYGLGDRESYHYAAGVNFLAANDSLLTSNLTTGGSTFCNNDDILFSTSAGSGLNAYYWDFGDGDSSNLAIPTHSFDTGGTYNISCILDYGCIIDTIYDTLIIDECFNVMSDTTQCSGTSVLLYAWGSGTGYTWVDSASFATILGTDSTLNVLPSATSTYAVYNLTDTLYTTVTVLPSATSSHTFIECTGFSITVGTSTYSSTGVFIDTLTSASSTGCDSIVTTDLTILPTSNYAQSLSGCEGFTVTVNSNTYSTSGVYVDTLVNAVGCDSTITTTLIINSTATSTMMASICQGDSLLFGGQWYSTAGNYFDTIQNGSAFGCDSIAEASLSVLPLSDATIISDSMFCENDPTTDLQAASSGGLWSGTGITNQSVGTFDPGLAASGNHLVTYGIDGLCGDTVSATIRVNENPYITVSSADDSCSLANGSIDLEITGGILPYSYLWNNSSIAEDLNSLSSGTYTVVVTDSMGCTRSETVVIHENLLNCSGELWLPNIFSPNNDQLNDMLYVRGAETAQSFVFMVYNRWGEKIFETTEHTVGWDGTYRGEPLNSAVFAYVVTATFIDGTEAILNGTVTLVR